MRFLAALLAIICRYICIARGGSVDAQACCSYSGYRASDATRSSVTTPAGRAGKNGLGAAGTATAAGKLADG